MAVGSIEGHGQIVTEPAIEFDESDPPTTISNKDYVKTPVKRTTISSPDYYKFKKLSSPMNDINKNHSVTIIVSTNSNTFNNYSSILSTPILEIISSTDSTIDNSPSISAVTDEITSSLYDNTSSTSSDIYFNRASVTTNSITDTTRKSYTNIIVGSTVKLNVSITNHTILKNKINKKVILSAKQCSNTSTELRNAYTACGILLITSIGLIIIILGLIYKFKYINKNKGSYHTVVRYHNSNVMMTGL